MREWSCHTLQHVLLAVSITGILEVASEYKEKDKQINSVLKLSSIMLN